jgi:electron transport complex protein RnfE
MSQAGLMFGDAGAALKLTIIPDHPGFLLAMLPPGAFISLGLLIAGKNWIDAHRARRQVSGRQTVVNPADQVGQTPSRSTR